MFRRSPFLLIPVLVGFLALIPEPASGCAIAPRKGETGASIQTTSEQAVILYDEATRTEHFIRTASFAGSSADFGFLVPTPSQPEIKEAEGTLYHELVGVTKPRIEVRKVNRSSFNIGCGMMSQSKFVGVAAAVSPAPKAESNVSVVEQSRVGNLDYAILKADTPQALRDWFVKNGYDDRPELTEWLKPYIAMKWYISAFKMAAETTGSKITAKDNPNAPAKTYLLSGTTVRMSFQTDRPFYPYREPSDAQKSNPPGGRMLRVYMLASTISTGMIGFENGKAWPGKPVWAGLAPPEPMQKVLEQAKLTDEAKMKKAWYLTEFEDRSSPRPGTDEVYFGPAADQSPIERPAIVQYDYVDTTSRDYATFYGVVFVFAMSLLIVVVAVFKRLTRKN